MLQTRLRWRGAWVLGAVALFLATGGALRAAPMHLNVVVTPKQTFKLDFEDGSKHFVLFLQRVGTAKSEGALDGATVTEYGMHDIVPGHFGDPRGYLAIAAKDGSMLYIKWRVRAVFVPGANGKPTILDNGYWEVAGATGSLKGIKGAGTLGIHRVAKDTDREFVLTGELVK